MIGRLPKSGIKKSMALKKSGWTSIFRDHGGVVSPLKIGVLIALCLPALLLGLQAAQGALGSRPVVEAIHSTGVWSLRCLLLSLLVTPLRQILHWPRLMLVRRMVGVAAAVYAMLHLLLYAADQNWRLLVVAWEIGTRVYLTVGAIALSGLLLLGVTSTNGWIRRLGGQNWRRVHRLSYGIGILALIHFTLQSKIDVSQAMLMTGFFIWLMGYRVLSRNAGSLGIGKLALLSLMACFATAIIEAAWYGLASGAPFLLVLRANVEPAFGWRPALWVACAGAALVTLRVAALRLRPAQRQNRSYGP
ncbi:sulfite oxidase heme-binding subunit YedZ [Pseudoroseomonas globiformis]|uniref:Protein-methionine-sulfoxide reductase heme-binding subunit MsrQ n=1 Tax=Teichococcus globiformis TaxID=2307229 RepID=A0ABV7G2U0_9PROT